MTEIRMRAGDADRARVVAQLERHLAEGRLDVGEFDGRVARAYAAVHVDELPPLLADLPGEPEPVRPERSQRRWPRPAPPVLLLVAGAASVLAVLGGRPPVRGVLLLIVFLHLRGWGRRYPGWHGDRRAAGRERAPDTPRELTG